MKKISLKKNRRVRGNKLADNQPKLKKEETEYRRFRRVLIVLGTMVIMTFCLSALASWRSSPVVSNATPNGTPPALPAAAPAKEYVYAGNALISTVESFRQPPNDLAVWRPTNGYWYILGANQQTVYYQWGALNDNPIPADFDGDDKADFCVFRPSTRDWHIIKSSDGSYSSSNFGESTDVPAPADYDGDGKADIAVYRPSDGYWHIVKSTNAAVVSQQFGASGDKPTPGDFDGDGRSDCVVWRNSTATFHVLKSSDSQPASYSIGASGDEPVIGDYDGDGKFDYAARRRTTTDNYWRIRYSSDGSLHSEAWGLSTDIAVQGSYNDGDAKTDIAVWRPSNGVWYIRKSTDGTMRADQWGTNGDIPVAAPFRRQP